MDESTASTPSAKPARNEDFPFDGFVELVKAPLEVRDPVSFKRVRKALQETVQLNQKQPFTYDRKALIEMLDAELAAVQAAP